MIIDRSLIKTDSVRKYKQRSKEIIQQILLGACVQKKKKIFKRKRAKEKEEKDESGGLSNG